MKKTLRGYMTLEATLVIPVVWFSLFFMIFAGFFQYDRCIAEQDSKRIALRASEIRDKEEKAMIRQVMGEESVGEQKLLFSRGGKRMLHVAKDKVKVEMSGSVDTILKGFLKGISFNAFSYEIRYEVKKYDPVGFIRICRRLEDYGGN